MSNPNSTFSPTLKRLTQYELCFKRSKNDIRNTWKIINEILSKNKANKILYFKENGINITNKTDTANKFNNYFTSIAQTIAQGIQYDGNTDYIYHLKKRVDSVFRFKDVDKKTVKKIIESLPTKNICGCDGISSKLLKIIELVIIKPLILLINRVINTGIFRDKLKVIPIFKKDDSSLFKNYRPISLFPTI